MGRLDRFRPGRVALRIGVRSSTVRVHSLTPPLRALPGRKISAPREGERIPRKKTLKNKFSGEGFLRCDKAPPRSPQGEELFQGEVYWTYMSRRKSAGQRSHSQKDEPLKGEGNA